MPAISPFCHLLGINPATLSPGEFALLEAELFLHICKELKEHFRVQHKNYFYLMRFTEEMENTMLETNLARLITKDILSTEEYNLAGIARYADASEDVVQDVIDGRNERPSATLLCRIIELHRSVRRELYSSIMKKVVKNEK